MRTVNRWLVGITLILFGAANAAALTSQQVRDADELLRQMDAKIAVLRGCVQEAERGTTASGRVALTPAQIQILEDCFKTSVPDLLTMYNSIPKQ